MLLIHGLSCKLTHFTKRATSAARRIGHINAEAKGKKKKRTSNKVSVISVRLEI